MDMYSKDFDECKYQLFYEFRDKKHGAWNVKYFIMDFEEEKKIDATLANAQLKKDGANQLVEPETVMSSENPL